MITPTSVDTEAIQRSKQDPCFKWIYSAHMIMLRYEQYASDAVVHHRSCDQIYADYDRDIQALGQPRCEMTVGSVAADQFYAWHLLLVQESWYDTFHESWIICNEDPLSLTARQHYRYHLRLMHRKCEPDTDFPFEPVTESQTRRCNQGKVKIGVTPGISSSPAPILTPLPSTATTPESAPPGVDVPSEISFPGSGLKASPRPAVSVRK